MRQPSASTAQYRGPESQSAQQEQKTLSTSDGDALNALSAAGDRFVRVSGTGGTKRSRPSLSVALIVALFLGGLLSLRTRIRYRAVATLELQDKPSPEWATHLGDELLSFAWRFVPDDRSPESTFLRWSVETPTRTQLRLCRIDSDHGRAKRRVRATANAFCQHHSALADAKRGEWSGAEKILSKSLARLKDQLKEASRRLDAANAAVALDDPAKERRKMLGRWQSLTDSLAETRTALTHLREKIARVRSAPVTTHGVVSRERREQALHADTALQQDLEELRVNLTELKLYLLRVWQDSAGPLEQLILVAGELTDFLKTSRAPTVPASGSDGFGGDADPFVAYVDSLSHFTVKWNGEFKALSRREPDPLTAEILDTTHRLRRDLNAFLYTTGKQLSALQARVRAVQTDPTDTAKQHVFQSKLTRLFRRVERAHQRFRFSAGGLSMPRNFRLDAAVTSAGGLHRRCRDRIRHLDEQLAAEAARLAAKQRKTQLATLEKQRVRLQAEIDRRVDDLLALQESLNLNVDQSTTFIASTLRAEFAATRHDRIAAALHHLEIDGRSLEALRLAAVPPDIKLVACDVFEEPIPPAERWAVPALAAAGAFVMVLFGQWWIIRRS